MRYYFLVFFVVLLSCCRDSTPCGPIGCGHGFICNENLQDCICPPENIIHYQECVPKWEGLYFSDQINQTCSCLNHINAIWIVEMGEEELLQISIPESADLGPMPTNVIQMDISDSGVFEFEDLLFGYPDNLPCKFDNKYLIANIYYNVYQDSIVMKVDYFEHISSGIYPDNPETLMTCNLKFRK